MDQFIYSVENFVCDGAKEIGAAKLHFDICVSPNGREFLYYFVVGFLIVLAFGIVSAFVASKQQTPE